jgi:bifunctional non-homologous end joining protein LigD
MEKTSLYFKEGSSDKEYHVQLDGGTVMVQYGRRGNALTSITKCQDIDPVKAMKIYRQLVNEKTAKGYRPGDNGTQYATPVNPDQTGYVPQLLNEVEEETAKQLYRDDQWLMQEKEDGRNIGIIYHNRRVVAANKKGLAISIPEKIIKVIESTFSDDITFCGELVGDVFKVWDVIHFLHPLSEATCLQRYNILKTLIDIIPGNSIQITKTAITQEEKIALFNEMRKVSAEGVVFKRKDSLYKPGRPNSGGDQIKYKFRATCSVVAGEQNEGKRSVEMWIYDSLIRVHVGNVTIYPNQDIPKIGQVMEVKYLYAFKGGSLFQPVYKGPRDDVHADECQISQLKYKRELVESED